jgi:hypothetical protein
MYNYRKIGNRDVCSRERCIIRRRFSILYVGCIYLLHVKFKEYSALVAYFIEQSPNLCTPNYQP